MAGAEGINKKGISWIDTEDDEGLKQDWDDETNIIENHLSSQGYNKCGSGKFFSDRTYAWVLHRFRRYIHDLPDKIKGYRGVVEDREYLEYFRDDQFVFSPWENKSKNKVALVWQFYDHHGFLVSEPYYKYFSLTTPPSWYHNKFELHIGEDYRYDACPICDYTNPMTTQSDARKLAAHIYSHGPIINGSPFNDFYIDIEPQYSDDEEANVGWGNPMWGPDVEIIASQLPYLYGFDFAEYWSPTKSQEARLAFVPQDLNQRSDNMEHIEILLATASLRANDAVAWAAMTEKHMDTLLLRSTQLTALISKLSSGE
jgi:hypothetical protein